MKILYVLLLLLVVGCSSHQIKTENNYENVDSIIQSSKITFVKNDSVNRESEKIITQKVNQTVAKIETLKEEVTVAKNALNEAVKNPKVIKITVTDTVYIEKKKNFWGKEKTTIKAVSDSTLVEDSTGY